MKLKPNTRYYTREGDEALVAVVNEDCGNALAVALGWIVSLSTGESVWQAEHWAINGRTNPQQEEPEDLVEEIGWPEGRASQFSSN
jgi:hypothetical protein